jgi:uncharacterized protein (TIGR03437 family)
VSVKSVGGTIVFDGRGGYEFTGRGGVGAEGASSAASKGTYSSRGLGRILMDSPAWAGKKMTVQAGDGGAILSGTAADGQHGIFIAVRAPDGDANAATLSGDYGGGYLSFRGGSVGGITTALAEFTSDGAGALSAASLTGHAAWIDDVNRTEKSEKLPYTLRADGTGSIRFAAASDFIAGEREMLVSTGGNYVLGFGTGPGQRDVLVLVRRARESASFLLSGMYWISEICAENSFQFNPNSARVESAWGSARMDGAATSVIAEQLFSNGRNSMLNTVMPYQVTGDGRGLLAPEARAGVTNFTMTTGGQAFAGALVGRAGELSLEHGIFLGFKAPAANGPGVYLSPLGVVNSASLAPSTGEIAPGTVLSLFGTGLSSRSAVSDMFPLPTELGGVQVRVGGVAAPILLVSPGQINIQAPFQQGTEPSVIQVINNGTQSNAVPVVWRRSSPGVYSLAQGGTGAAIATHADFQLITPQNPARGGETIILFLTGLGGVEPKVAAGAAVEGLSRVTDTVSVLFDGRRGDVSFAGLTPGFAGLYQVNVTLPAITGANRNVSLEVETSDVL